RSGASAGRVAPPRVEFDTQVRSFAPCSASALYRLIGMPTTAKPPKPTTDPSGTSATASAKLGKTLDLGIIPPATPKLSSRRRPGAGRDPLFGRTTSGQVGPGLRRDDG